MLLAKTAFFNRNKKTSSDTKTGKETPMRLLAAAASMTFECKGRDPFTLYMEKPAPVSVKKQAAIEKKAPGEVTPPAIILTGILWNPDNPLAMIKLADGTKCVAKTGQTVSGDITVRRIDQKSIVVVSGGKEFTFKR